MTTEDIMRRLRDEGVIGADDRYVSLNELEELIDRIQCPPDKSYPLNYRVGFIHGIRAVQVALGKLRKGEV